jgi:hypothetical protein
MKRILHASRHFRRGPGGLPCGGSESYRTVTAADTGDPLTGVTVTAILKPTSASQSGQYLLCARPQPQSPYLDPCQWGGPVGATVGTGAVPVALTLQEGVRFIVRVHDPNQLLPQADTAPGTAVSASVTSASISQFPLAVVYADALVRDYGTIVPTNVPLSVTVSSATLVRRIPQAPLSPLRR